MKDKDRRRARAADLKVCRSSNKYISITLLAIFILASAMASTAQTLDVKDRFVSGEQINYEVYFKWGLIMSRAGLANMSISEDKHDGKETYMYRLLFNTSGIIEKIYKMRDTLDCWFTPNMLLIHAQKRVNENDYYLIDDLKFDYSGKKTTAHSHRYTPTRTKIDTLLISEDGYMFDMLGASLYLRSIDWDNLKSGDVFPFKVAIGKDVVNITYRYSGQQVVERGNSKYKTRHFYIDIYDEAFTQNKEAAEIWVGDDENHVVVKIRAKLKIGAAEVYYKSSSGLKYPFSCEVKTQKK